MRKLKAFGAVLTIFLMTFASAGSFSAVLGRDVNVPAGTSIFYWSGANTTINVPTSFQFPTGNISILAFDNLGGNVGTGDTLLLTLILSVSGKPTTFPWSLITTNEEAAAVQKLAFNGTPVYINKKIGSTEYTLNNIFIVTEDELSVSRHGNSITADFTPVSPIQLKFPSTPWWPTPNVLYPLDLPEFHITVEKYGGSIHSEESRTFATSKPIPTMPPIVLSGYTIASDKMGFYADATFTCPSWLAPRNVQTASDAMVVMHGINTVIPP